MAGLNSKHRIGLFGRIAQGRKKRAIGKLFKKGGVLEIGLN